MFHNLNTLQSRSGCQLPFSSINFGTCTYPEGRMVTEEILNVSIEGLGSYGKTSIFPCSIFQYMKGVNDKPGTPNYDLYKLALRSTSQRLYPNYVNCQWTNQKEWVTYDRKLKSDVINNLSKDDYAKLVSIISTDQDTADCLDLYLDNENHIMIKTEEHPVEIASTMGCRTVNGADINFREVYEKNINNVLNGRGIDKTFRSAAQKDGRGNICPVTIILPTIAMIAKSKSEKKNSDIIIEFFELLDKKISEAKDTLIERFNHICSQPAEAAKFMWENNTMVGYVENEGPISAIKHGTLVIGQLGLAETLQILIGCDHTTEKGMELAECIELMFADRCKEYKETYKLNFGVYYTPAENLCYTAMKKFKSTYGIIPNVSDKEYFTNSMHVPVWKNINPFEKIDIESRLTGYSNAGCITYVELPSTTKHNIEALETIVNYAMDKDIPYFAINIPVDTCQNCMYTDEINDVCPKCGSDNILKLRRVTGYLSSDYRNFNKGKQAEVNQRTKHIQN
jgi:ribonucleoside-triphosphate reductase